MAEWIISSSVLILAVVLLRRVLRGKLSPRLQYALWALVLVRLLVPVSFGAAEVSVQNLVRGADERAAQRVVTYVGHETPELSAPEPVPGLGETGHQTQYDQDLTGRGPGPEATESEAEEETDKPVTVSDLLHYAWYLGMTALALWFLATNIVFRVRISRSARRIKYPGCTLRLYVSGKVETPCLFGAVRPAIYLTPGAAEDPVTLRHSVEHELTHFRHGDHIWALLRCLCLVLHWYNPLVWLAAALSRGDAELACDEATIRRLGEAERAAYGRTLIDITCQSRTRLLRTATTMSCGRRGIKERVALIVKKPKTAAYALVILILAAVFVTGCTFTGASEEEPNAETLEGFIAENTGLAAGEGQYLAASYELLLEEDDTYYVNCCVTVFELAEDRTLTMADNVLTPMSLTLRRSVGGWTQETFWMPEDGDYNDPELEERFPQAALERLSELRTRSGLPLAMRCFEKAVPALDADVAAAIEPYLSALVESGTTVEEASSTRNMAYAMIAFYGNCAVEYMQEQLKQPDISEERRLIINEAIAYIEEARDPDETSEPDPDTIAGLMSAITAEDITGVEANAGGVTAEQLATALNAAAENQSALDQDGLDTWYSLTAYLADGRLELRAGLEENAVYVRYERSTGSQEAMFTDSELYWLIRDSYSTRTNIEAAHYEKCRSVIEARAERTVQSAEKYGGGPAFTGYELTSFELKDSFEGDSVRYEVYAWSVAYTTDDPDVLPVAREVSFDAEGRVTGYDSDSYLAVMVLGDGSFDYRFMSSELYQGPNEAAGRENARAEVLAAFSERPQPPVKVLLATDELLEGYGDLPEYGDSAAEYAKRLLLLPEQTLSGFKFVQLTPSFTEFYITNVIYETGELTPETPIILWAVFPGDAPQFGLVFTDPSLTEWHLGLSENWVTGGIAMSDMGRVQPEDIHDLSSATLEIFGGSATVTDGDTLSEIESLLSASTEITQSNCGFGAVLRLEREDGAVLTLSAASDSCATWMYNGWCYDYGDGNEYLYSFFVYQIIHGMDMETLYGTYGGKPLQYMNWTRYYKAFGSEESTALIDEIFERAKTDHDAFIDFLYNTEGLDGALYEYYGHRLAQLYEYDAANFAQAFYGMQAEQETQLLNMLSVAMDAGVEEIKAQIQELW